MEFPTPADDYMTADFFLIIVQLETSEKIMLKSGNKSRINKINYFWEKLLNKSIKNT